MALNKAYNQYKENSVYTSSPEELTFMLYNGLVKFIMLAQTSIEDKDIEKAHNSIGRAQDIVLHFQNTLDMKYEVSQGLDLIYDYMYRRLVEANINKDKSILDEVLGMSRELRDTWSQAMKLAKQKRPAAQIG
jgi:flagellar biosynthetic protein FliS